MSVKDEICELETFLNQLFAPQLEVSKSRARLLEEGDTPYRFFFHVENERHAKAFVSSVFNASGSRVFSFPEIMEAHSNFSSNLFSRDDIDLEAQGDLFSLVTARLSKSQKTLCEGPLTLAEVSQALRQSNRNKSPGIDDLTVEFYAHLWDKLG